MEVKTLVLYFVDADGSKVSITIDNPKFDITEQEIKTAMDQVITDDVLVGKMDAKLVAKHSAQIVTRHVEVLDIEQ